MSYEPYYYSKYNNLSNIELLTLLDAEHKRSPIIRELMSRLEQTEISEPNTADTLIHEAVTSFSKVYRCKECECPTLIMFDYDGENITVNIK